MKLDTRQRAMLDEMGIRVWLPQEAPRPAADVPRAPAAPAPAAPAPAPSPAREPAQAMALPAVHATGPLPWQLGEPRPLYPQAPAAPGTVWLIVLDSLAPDDPGSGEDGQLLHNMLRAMGLKDRSGVYVSTVRRGAAADSGGPGLQQMLQALRPGIVLALGQSAARCVLGGGEPLQTLRQRGHRLADGTPVVVSYAPGFLLRKPQAKKPAWADLQQAMALAEGRGAS